MKAEGLSALYGLTQLTCGQYTTQYYRLAITHTWLGKIHAVTDLLCWTCLSHFSVWVACFDPFRMKATNVSECVCERERVCVCVFPTPLCVIVSGLYCYGLWMVFVSLCSRMSFRLMKVTHSTFWKR